MPSSARLNRRAYALAQAANANYANDPMLAAFLAAAGPDGCCILASNELEKAWLNPVLQATLGASPAPDTLPIVDWGSIIADRDIPSFRAALAAIKSQPLTPPRLALSLIQPNGSPVTVDASFAKLASSEPSHELIVAAFRKRIDTATDRDTASPQDTSSDDDALQTVLSLAPVISFRWFEAPDGRYGFTEVSGRMEDIFGVTAADYKANPDLLQIHPEDMGRWRETILAATEELSIWSFEGRFVLPDGSIRWWLGKSRPHRQADGTVVFTGVIVDIHESKQRALDLEVAHERLSNQTDELRLQAEVMERAVAEGGRAREVAEAASNAKTAFLATMSHELRTPLNAILGYAELLTIAPYGEIADERYRRFIEDIQGSGLSLLALIEDLFDLAKVEAGQKEMHREPIWVANLVDRCIRMVRPRAMERNQSLLRHPISDRLLAHVDEKAIQQVLINLLTNASKFTPECGTVAVECQIGQRGILTLAVRDSGPGIPEDDLERVFQPFERGYAADSADVEGTGLGLSIVQALMHLHGGSVRAERPADGGARFVLTFPAGTATIAPRIS